MTVDAVVFDFDGVIIDREVTNLDAWSATFARFGVELTVAEYIETMGGHHGSIYELLTRKATLSVPDEASVRAAKRARHHELLSATDVLPGVANWITDARQRGFGVGIASSADESWLSRPRVGLARAFDAICCCDSELPPTPAPNLYLRACELLGVAPASALAIEDSATGLLAARSLGWRRWVLCTA